MPASSVDSGDLHAASSIVHQRSKCLSFPVRISDTLSVTSIGAVLCTNRHDGQAGSLHRFLALFPLPAWFTWWASVGGTLRHRAPRSLHSFAAAFLEAVCRHKSHFSPLRCRTCDAGPFLDLPPLRSFEGILRCKKVGRHPEVDVVECVMPISNTGLVHATVNLLRSIQTHKNQHTQNSDMCSCWPTLETDNCGHLFGWIRMVSGHGLRQWQQVVLIFTGFAQVDKNPPVRRNTLLQRFQNSDQNSTKTLREIAKILKIPLNGTRLYNSPWWNLGRIDEHLFFSACRRDEFALRWSISSWDFPCSAPRDVPFFMHCIKLFFRLSSLRIWRQ